MMDVGRELRRLLGETRVNMCCGEVGVVKSFSSLEVGLLEEVEIRGRRHFSFKREKWEEPPLLPTSCCSSLALRSPGDMVCIPAEPRALQQEPSLAVWGGWVLVLHQH